MFDAKSLLEMMVRGASPSSPQAQPATSGGLEDLLGQLLGGGRQQGSPAGGTGAGNSSGINSLEDLMKQFSGGSAASSRAAAPEAGQSPAAAGQAQPPGQSQGQSQGGGGFLDDLLRNLTQSQPGASAAPGSQDASPAGQAVQPGGGGLVDILGQILGQATSGVKEGAQRIDNATGTSGQLSDILTKATGKSPEELMNAAREFIQNNQLGAGAAAGGLGAVVLGTQTGRALAGSALKLGALALIGGLAYKAVQNYQTGKPVLGSDAPQALIEAPAGSGYEARAVTHDSALLYIRAMIAAAAADGRVDQNEMDKIIGGLKEMGVDREAEEFLANELNNPATPEALASAVKNDAEAVQVFTAARIAIDLDNQQEHDFLVRLAGDLGLDRQLVAHIDATARQAA